MLSNEIIYIVSGLPRSGTSLLMQMLDAGGANLLTDNHRLPDEDNPKGYLEYEPVKNLRTNKDWVADSNGKVVKVIHALLPELPAHFQYKIIFINRNIEEIVASQAKMLQRSGRIGANLPTDKLTALFNGEKKRIVQWVSEQTNMQMIEVDYQNIIQDPILNAQKMADFLNLDLDVSQMVQVVDASLYRNKV